MASFLFGIGQAILFRDHKKKLKRYHEEATIESILDDLTKILKPKSNQLDSLQTRFSIDGAQDTERYWDEACFARYLKNQHGILIPEPAIPILWRCLHFYAYHPFQHTAPDRLDYKAFQRAIALLAVQGTDLLGTDEYGDAYWHNNREYAEKADFKRIFRSISVPVEEVKYESVDVLNDAMDVLAMVQPRMMPFLPSQSELEPVVRRVLGDGISVRYDLQRKDLVVLVDLMLKLRLYTPRWGDNFHYGTFERSDSGGLADILVDALGDLSELSDTAMELLVSSPPYTQIMLMSSPTSTAASTNSGPSSSSHPWGLYPESHTVSPAPFPLQYRSFCHNPHTHIEDDKIRERYSKIRSNCQIYDWLFLSML
ncbi:hypothetical protein ASPWEDRAFT_489922 [Aspergillus wentii DTO 134E9]|uniref:Uncharacterized protein n=1 Tax=Aspergillus wentii DTO 134E9 TaxID=1073089 RepID=A0A1L9RJD4_ASPWE|nr:uncharacterized protein ASPWEDRAFT_489922 [Aspergillus wentii DTO 134E9]OJJ35056.1 hypothetical protein ASPWEDRAFT_489922 [Aspergillus wentii DTO 134E9]